MTNQNDPRSPVKTLVGFKRVSIPAGRDALVKFAVDPEFFHTYVDEYQHFEKHSGMFLFRCGDQ